MSAENFRPQVIRMLGNRSPEDFIRLSAETRMSILALSQVRQGNRGLGPVVVQDGGDDIVNPDLKDGAVLRQKDLVGEQICREATELYYWPEHIYG